MKWHYSFQELPHQRVQASASLQTERNREGDGVLFSGIHKVTLELYLPPVWNAKHQGMGRAGYSPFREVMLVKGSTQETTFSELSKKGRKGGYQSWSHSP